MKHVHSASKQTLQVLVLTVFLYWARVLLLASFCEPIGQALQPLTKIF